MRVVIQDGNLWRPLFWFRVTKDCSVYLGPRYKKVNEMRVGEIQPNKEGLMRVGYGDGSSVEDPDILRDAHISFHGSGITHAGGERFQISTLRELARLDLLCFALFQKLDSFQAIQTKQIRKRDVCLAYPIDQNKPLAAQLYASPIQKEFTPIRIGSAEFQINLVFIYQNLDLGSLVLQLVLFHGLEGPWPPYTFMLFPFKDTEHASVK